MNRAEIIALFLRLDEQNPSEPLDGILALTSAAAGIPVSEVLGALREEPCPSSSS